MPLQVPGSRVRTSLLTVYMYERSLQGILQASRVEMSLS